MTTQAKKEFIEAQLEVAQTPIFEFGAMQRAFKSGGSRFEKELAETAEKLGGWLAIEEELKNQLAALQIETDPSLPSA